LAALVLTLLMVDQTLIRVMQKLKQTARFEEQTRRTLSTYR
jgi:hypothetical protein